MQAGDVITTENMRAIRPGSGLPVKYYDAVVNSHFSNININSNFKITHIHKDSAKCSNTIHSCDCLTATQNYIFTRNCIFFNNIDNLHMKIIAGAILLLSLVKEIAF